MNNFSLQQLELIDTKASKHLQDDYVTINTLLKLLDAKTIRTAAMKSFEFSTIIDYLDLKWRKTPERSFLWRHFRQDPSMLNEQITVSALSKIIDGTDLFKKILTHKLSKWIRIFDSYSYETTIDLASCDIIAKFYTDILDKKFYYINTLGALLHNADKNKIIDELNDTFRESDNNLKGYAKLIEKLINKNICGETDPEMIINVVWCCKDYNGKYHKKIENCYYDVHGRKNSSGRMTYALEFTPWETWLKYVIHPRSIMLHTVERCIAGCLFEMTFFGFNEYEMNAQKRELERRCDEFKKWKKEGTLDQHCKPVEEVFKELKKKYKKN